LLCRGLIGRLEIDAFFDGVGVIVERGICRAYIRAMGDQVFRFGLISWIFWEVLREDGIEIVVEPFMARFKVAACGD